MTDKNITKWIGKFKPYKFVKPDGSEIVLYQRENVLNALLTIILEDRDPKMLLQQLAEAINKGEPI